MTSVAESTSPGQSGHDGLDAEVLKIAGVVVLGAVMAILDITVVNVALPTFTKVFNTRLLERRVDHDGLHVGPRHRDPADGLGRGPFRHQAPVHAALVAFILGSALCSTATSIEMLIGFRVIQGLGGGMLMPLGMTIMTHAAGPDRVGRVMAVLGVPMLLGPIGGPILGGWLIQDYGWHWIFLINVPIGIVAISLALVILPRDQPGAVRDVRLRRHADAVAGSRALPVRGVVRSWRGHDPGGEGADPRHHRPRCSSSASCSMHCGPGIRSSTCTCSGTGS